MSVYLARIARFSFLRRRLVAGIWLVIVFAVVIGSQVAGGKTVDDFSVPGTQSQHAVSLLKERIPALGGTSTSVVIVGDHGQAVTGPAQEAALAQVTATLLKTDQVSQALDPITTHGVSTDGKAAMQQIQYTTSAGSVKNSTLDAVKAAYAPAEAAGLKVEFSGPIYPGSRTTASQLPDLIGISVGFLILIVTFGAVLVAFLPIVTAIAGVLISLMTISLLASFVSIATVSTALATMLGLSCGIDYALFILSRYRNNVVAGDEMEDAVALAAGTAGSSVVFAALTVVIALCGLSVVGIPFLTVMGLSAAGAVLLSMVISLTLLPALLGFCGLKVVKFVRPKAHPDRPADIARIAALEPSRTRGAGWARFVTSHRLVSGGIAVAIMLVIAIPLLSLHLGLPSGKSKPASETSHQAYNLTTEHFGVGANASLIVVVDLAKATSSDAATTVTSALRSEPGVASAVLATNKAETALITVTPKTGPEDTRTSSLVKQIRADAPALQARTGTQILVGGTTASNIDTSKKLGQALPLFLAVVAGLAFILLTLAFRTILVPIKSVIGFLLSVAAALGAEVAVFQWGWLKGVLGVNPGETLSFLPLISLAIVFGLSSDYEVFVVSRIREDFSQTGDGAGAVVRGAGKAARVVTAAALIMFSVFVSFIFNSDSTVKAIGLTLAVAVFLDAFLVRLTLVPAVMALVKGPFWYHPQWFAKYVPDFDIEGEKLEHLMHPDRELVDATPVPID